MHIRMKNSLTPKQEAFAIAYLKTGNATAAYREAYAPKTMSDASINREAHTMVNHPKVALRLAELKKPALDQTQADITRTIKELVSVAYAKVDEPVRWADKLNALEKLMRHQGLLKTDHAQITPNLAIQIVLGK